MFCGVGCTARAPVWMRCRIFGEHSVRRWADREIPDESSGFSLLSCQGGALTFSALEPHSDAGEHPSWDSKRATRRQNHTAGHHQASLSPHASTRTDALPSPPRANRSFPLGRRPPSSGSPGGCSRGVFETVRVAQGCRVYIKCIATIDWMRAAALSRMNRWSKGSPAVLFRHPLTW